MSQKTLSIITINYNNLSGLERTLKSVVSQDFKEIEYVVIDGASSDGSVLFLEEHKSQIDILVSEKDNGIYNAMNKGIALAKGDYLLFLNSGDVFTSTNAVSDFMAHSLFKGDIIYGDYKFEEGSKEYPDELPYNYFMGTSLPHQSTIYKREVFENIGNYDEQYRLGADRAHYIKCFLSGVVKFQHIPYALSLFDVSGLSNDPAHKELKKKEDEHMLRTFYGDAFDLFLEEQRQKRRVKEKERNSLKGIAKRIYNRLLK